MRRRRYLWWCHYILWVPFWFFFQIWNEKLSALLSLYHYALSVLSVNVITVLYINWTVLLKRCFIRINPCLYELIWCAGEESVCLYTHIATVIHPQPLIAVSYKSDKSHSTTVHVRMCFGFLFVMLLIFSTPCFQFAHLF